MPELNIWMPCFDDLDQLKEAIASTAEFSDDITVYVVDGRYETFDGDADLTDGAEEFCATLDHVEYAPPPSLPLGDPEAHKFLRSPQHEQAKFVNYELLPQGEWAMEMDTDERLETLDADALSELKPRRKYTPEVLTPGGEQLWPAIRLYQPEHWTVWIDDVMFWKEYYPRSTPIDDLFDAHMNTKHRNTGYGGETDAIRLRNHGADRPEEYQNRRADQLERMGSGPAAQAVRDGEYPSLVNLSEYKVRGEKVEEKVGDDS